MPTESTRRLLFRWKWASLTAQSIFVVVVLFDLLIAFYLALAFIRFGGAGLSSWIAHVSNSPGTDGQRDFAYASIVLCISTAAAWLLQARLRSRWATAQVIEDLTNRVGTALLTVPAARRDVLLNELRKELCSNIAQFKGLVAPSIGFKRGRYLRGSYEVLNTTLRLFVSTRIPEYAEAVEPVRTKWLVRQRPWRSSTTVAA